MKKTQADINRALLVSSLKNVLVEAGATADAVSTMDDGAWAIAVLRVMDKTLPSPETRKLVVQALRGLESTKVPKTPPAASVAYAHIPLEAWNARTYKLPKDWKLFGKRVIIRGRHGVAFVTIQDRNSDFVVRLDAGEWPSKRRLVNACTTDPSAALLTCSNPRERLVVLGMRG